MKPSSQHIADATKAAKAPAYVQDSGNGLYTGFVAGRGFRANCSLVEALAFIRKETGLTSGAVPCFDEISREWVDEFDLAEGA